MDAWSVEVQVPVRVCDLGGWTDTWFAGPGRVLNIGVEPGVLVRVRPRAGVDGTVLVQLRDLDARAVWRSGQRPSGPHALVTASVARGLGDAAVGAIEIVVESAVPPGASMGTSASVSVGLIAALRAVAGRSPLAPLLLAAAAHAVETDELGQQSGVQDQLCAVHGGLSAISMPRYPSARVRRLEAHGPLATALRDGMTVVYLGQPHDSSAIHEMVIAGLEARSGPSPALDELRSQAEAGARAVEAGSLDGFAAAMNRNTEAQRRLHAALVSPRADAVIGEARAAGAVGWKVNGAGGTGGSLTLLSPSAGVRQRVEQAVLAADPVVSVLPVRVADGVRVVTAGQLPSISSASSG